MKVPGYPDIPEDPALKEYARLLEEQRRLFGGKTLEEFEAAHTELIQPWHKVGISKELWEIHELVNQNKAIDQAVREGAAERVIREATEQANRFGSGSDLDRAFISPPLDHGAKQRQLETEKIQLQRRTVAALEVALDESRQREVKLEADKKDADARAFRWWLIGSIGLVAGLLLAALPMWKDWLGI